jgi:hypothetical protein
MWKKQRLHIPDNLQPVSCSTVAAHPWVFGLGQREASGFYLSPVNAVDYLIGRLAGADTRQDVSVFMFTASTLPAFVSVLASAADTLPIPALTQVKRRANAAAGLALSRMQLPAPPGGLPPSVPLSMATTRTAGAVGDMQRAITEAAAGPGVGGIAAELAAFTTQRAQMLATALAALDEVQAGSVDAWVFTATGDTQTAAALMKKDIPAPDAVFTLALMFIGQDLAQLRAMGD